MLKQLKISASSISIKISMIIMFISGIILYTGNLYAQSCCGSGHDGHKSDSTSMKTENHDLHRNGDFSSDSIPGNDNTVVKEIAWNAVCPVLGEPIDPSANKVEYQGKLYGFCCNGCDTKFKKDPEKYSSNLSEDGKVFTGKN